MARSRKLKYKNEFDRVKVQFLRTGEMTTTPENEWDAFRFEYDKKEQKRFWMTHRESIIKDFIVDHPGQRPYGWWLFDALEPRKRLKGYAIEKGHHEPMAYYYGVPENDTFFDLGIDKKRIKAADFETQVVYLKRHGLLTKTEEKQLKNIIK